MKRKFFALLASSVLALSLGACTNNGGSTPEPPAPPTSDEVVSNVFSHLAGNTLSLVGSLNSKMIFGTGEDAEEWDNGTYELETVLGNGFYFSRMSRDYGEPFGIESSTSRYDQGQYGEAIIYQLSPFTNTVVSNYVQDYYGRLIAAPEIVGQQVPFSMMFQNPFRRAASCFTAVIDDCISLTDPTDLDATFLFNVVFAGNVINSPLAQFDIGYDENYNPTTLDIVFREDTPYNSSIDTYSGRFVAASEIDVDPVPTPRQAQPGQEALQAIFDSLQAMNYTVEFECSVDLVDYDEETGEPTVVGTQDSTVKTYLTPTGYFYEFGGSLKEFEEAAHTGQFADHGEFETSRGLIEVQRNSDGSLFETRGARPIRTVEQKFADFWKYSAAAFDVQSDGSFTLANETGFDAYLRQNMMTDGTVYSPAFVQNLKLEIRDGNLYYEYHDEQARCSATIKNVGTTVLPIDPSLAAPFNAPTSWAEYAAISEWNAKQVETIDFMTGGHPEAIPFIYTPYDYERSANTDSDVEIIEIDEPPYIIWNETLKAVINYKSVHQFDTCDEAVKAYNLAYQQATGDGYFTLDVTKDTFYHVEGEGEGKINLAMKIYILKDYSTQLSDEGVFKYAVVVDVQNMDYMQQDPNIIVL